MADIVRAKKGGVQVATTDPECPAFTTQPDLPPVPLVPGTVPVDPTGQATAVLGVVIWKYGVRSVALTAPE